MLIVLVLVMIALGLLALGALVYAGAKGYRWAGRRVMGLERVDGFQLRADAYYHPGHTWAAPRPDGSVRVGLDDFARRLLGHVDAVRLPPRGSVLREGEPALEVNCWGRQARLRSPVSGVVTSVNQRVAEDGSPVSREPYGRGWLFAVAPVDAGFRALPTGATARRWLAEEADRLRRFFVADLGLTAADGGELVAHPPATLDAGQWAALTRKFFGTG
jgi:glycine cleavage system H lipoate-binding protein